MPQVWYQQQQPDFLGTFSNALGVVDKFVELGRKRRAEESTNALRGMLASGADLGDPKTLSSIAASYPEALPSILSSMVQAKSASATQEYRNALLEQKGLDRAVQERQIGGTEKYRNALLQEKGLDRAVRAQGIGALQGYRGALLEQQALNRALQERQFTGLQEYRGALINEKKLSRKGKARGGDMATTSTERMYEGSIDSAISSAKNLSAHIKKYGSLVGGAVSQAWDPKVLGEREALARSALLQIGTMLSKGALQQHEATIMEGMIRDAIGGEALMFGGAKRARSSLNELTKVLEQRKKDVLKARGAKPMIGATGEWGAPPPKAPVAPLVAGPPPAQDDPLGILR